MAIAFVQSAQNQASFSSCTTGFASNVAAGSLLVCMVMSDTDGDTLTSISDTRGNTYTNAITPTTVTGKGTIVGIFYAPNTTGGANNVFVQCNSGGLTVFLGEYSGAAATSVLDVANQTTGSSAAPSVSATTTVANDLLVGAVLNNRSSLTAGTGYTRREDLVFNNWFDYEDKLATTAGAYVADGTISFSGVWGAGIAAFKPQVTQTPTKVAFGTQPASSVSGNTMPTFTVQVQDASSAIVLGNTATVTITCSAGVLSGTTSVAAVNGTATFSAAIITGVNSGVTITAASSGLTSATSTSFNVTASGTTGAVDLTQLPVANRQLPNWSAYYALGVSSLAAGGSYTDPTTSRKIWKITSATVPAANSNAMHGYSSGPLQISQPWGSGGDQYTLYHMIDGSAGYLVDFSRAGGLTNRRTTPWSSDLRFSFSMVASTPQKIYYLDGGSQLLSYNTVSGVSTLKKAFAGAIGAQQCNYLQIDNTDRWFVFLDAAGTTVYAWDGTNDLLYTASETRMRGWRAGLQIDEPHFDKDGRYVYMKVTDAAGAYFNVGGGNFWNTMVWDLQNDKISDVVVGWTHSEGFKTLAMGLDSNSGEEQRLVPAPVTADGQVGAGTMTVVGTDSQFGAAEAHRAGQWDQPYTGSAQYEFNSLDAPIGGVPSSWTLSSGSVWQTTISYAYQQSVYGVGEVLERNAAGTQIANSLTKVANLAAVNSAGKWCIVGTTLSVWRSDSAQPDTSTKQVQVARPHLMHEGHGFTKADLSDVRLLAHHYSFNPNLTDYYASPRGTIARDGKLAMFTSNMGTYNGRKDAFLVEVPLAATTATQLLMSTQPSLTVVTGVAQATQPVVRVADAGSSTVTGDTSTVTAALVAVTGTGTAIGTLTKAAVAGLADFAANGLGVTSAGGGTFKWRFTDGALTSVDSSVFTVVGNAAAVAMVTQPGDGTSMIVLTTQPVVKIVDGQGVTVTGNSSTVTATLNTITGAGTAGGTLTKAASGGVASFTDLSVTTAAGGTFKWTFTDGALTSVQSALFTVAAVVAPGGTTGGSTSSTFIIRHYEQQRHRKDTTRYTR